jgi:hypothetical protein
MLKVLANLMLGGAIALSASLVISMSPMLFAGDYDPGQQACATRGGEHATCTAGGNPCKNAGNKCKHDEDDTTKCNCRSS